MRKKLGILCVLVVVVAFAASAGASHAAVPSIFCIGNQTYGSVFGAAANDYASAAAQGGFYYNTAEGFEETDEVPFAFDGDEYLPSQGPFGFPVTLISVSVGPCVVAVSNSNVPNHYLWCNDQGESAPFSLSYEDALAESKSPGWYPAMAVQTGTKQTYGFTCQTASLKPTGQYWDGGSVYSSGQFAAIAAGWAPVGGWPGAPVLPLYVIGA